MTKFFRDNSKKLLAVFGVVLMVAFILPSQTKMGNGRGVGTRVAGTVGPKNDKVHDGDISRTKYEWDLLEHRVMVMPQSARAGGPISFVNLLRNGGIPQLRDLPAQMQQHPEIFYLLQREADEMAVNASDETLDTLFSTGQLAVQMNDGRIVQFSDVGDRQYAAEVRQAVAGVFKVLAAADRAANIVKVSQPMVQHSAAGSLQEMRVRYVELTAHDMLAQVPAPTTEQLQAHLDKFASYSPKMPGTTENPHGFGYRYPNRVTLQYIAIPRAEARRVVRATQGDYEWDVAARKYYMKHQADFVTTEEPTTQPTTNPTDAFGLGRGATSQPKPAPKIVTKPFEQVRDEIVELLLAPDIDRKMKDVQDRVGARLTNDYETYKKEHGGPTTAPTTAPSELTSGYGSYEYLQKLAAEIEKETKVLPTVASVGEYKDEEQLRTLAGIGEATVGRVLFGRYATEFAAAVQTPPIDKATASLVLHLFQPSQLLKDDVNSMYYFRLTGVKPSAKPASLDEVKADVERDWKNARAYELAKQRADKLVEEARAAASLETAANNGSLRSIVSGFFDRDGNNASANAMAMGMAGGIENVTLPPDQIRAFRNGAFTLLTVAAESSAPTTAPSTAPTASANGRPVPPVTTIAMPIDQKVIVTELLALRPHVPAAAFVSSEARIARDIQEAFSGPIRNRWMAFDEVVKRMKWTDVNAAAKSAAAAAND